MEGRQTTVEQKAYFLELEHTCGVNTPLFLNTGDTWEYPEDKLKRANDLSVFPVIGRYRLLPENSGVGELWLDLEGGGEPFNKLAALAIDAIPLIKSFGVPEDAIYCKLSGRGIHIHIFISGLRSADQTLLLTKVIHQKLPMSKAHSLGSDPRCLVAHQKIREFGAKNGDHYATLIPITQLRKAGRKKAYPTNKKPEDVAYPKLKVFECTPQLIRRIHELEAEYELDKEKTIYGGEVDYDRDGDIDALYKCPVITQLAKKADVEHHLTHEERLAVCQTFICFGDKGKAEIHKIIAHCGDYNEGYVDEVIADNKKRNYPPFTCQWINDHVGCPKTCKGSGGRSPFKFAYTPIELKEIIKAYRTILELTPEDDEVIKICLADVLDPIVDGDLAWLFIVAHSGWGKTVFINSLHNPKWSIKKDLITEHTFVSGKTYKDKESGEDQLIEGLLPKLHKKTLLVKDFTTQLMHGESSRNAIFGQMRSIYDEEYDAGFGSIDLAKVPESWKHVRMGFIAGCTPYIDRYGTLNVILGERYLKIRMSKPDRVKAAERAAKLAFQEKKLQTILNKKVRRFLSNIHVPDPLPEVPERYRKRVVKLAEVIVHTRKPITEKTSVVGMKEYDYEDECELATRLTIQLIRLGAMLTFVEGTEAWNEEIFKYVTRAAIDTLIPSRAKILLYLYITKKPAIERDIRDAYGWGHHRVRKHLTHMVKIGVVREDDNKNYMLNPLLRRYLDEASLVQFFKRDPYTRFLTTTNNNNNGLPLYKAPNQGKNTLDSVTTRHAYAVEDVQVDAEAHFAYLSWHARHVGNAECAKCPKKYKTHWCIHCFRRGTPRAVEC